jgi:hypothetical protein
MTQSEVSPAELREQLESYDINLENKPLNAYTDLSRHLNLNAAAIGLGLEDVHYDPDEFPGLILAGDNVTSIVFGDGIIFIIAENETDPSSLVDVVVQKIVDLGLIEEPDSTNVEIEPDTVPVPDTYDEIINMEKNKTDSVDANSGESMSEPQEPKKYETDVKIAVDGEVIIKLKKKPDAIMTDLEVESAYRALADLLEIVMDGEEEPPGKLDGETLQEFNPSIQFWGEGEWDEEINYEDIA